MKLLLIGGLLGLIATAALTVAYFELRKFFAVSARALHRNQKAIERMTKEPQPNRPLQMKEAAPPKIEHNTAKAGS